MTPALLEALDEDATGPRAEVRTRGRRDGRDSGAIRWIVERVAGGGEAVCGATEAFELCARRKFRSDRAGIVIDLFLHHRAVQVVGAKAQRDLRDRGREHDPVGFDVCKIIEEQARYRDVAQVSVSGGFG